MKAYGSRKWKTLHGTTCGVCMEVCDTKALQRKRARRGKQWRRDWVEEQAANKTNAWADDDWEEWNDSRGPGVYSPPIQAGPSGRCTVVRVRWEMP